MVMMMASTPSLKASRRLVVIGGTFLLSPAEAVAG